MAAMPRKSDIWSRPKLREMLSQPPGSPVELTREEALEIVRQAAGRRPDLPPGEELVRQVRRNLGHSIVDRAKKHDE